MFSYTSTVIELFDCICDTRLCC